MHKCIVLNPVSNIVMPCAAWELPNVRRGEGLTPWHGPQRSSQIGPASPPGSFPSCSPHPRMMVPSSLFIGQTMAYSLVAQTVKHLSTMLETWVWSLGREDSLEKEMATHSRTLAWENPMDGGACCRLLSMGSQTVGHDWATSLSLWLILEASAQMKLSTLRNFQFWAPGTLC